MDLNVNQIEKLNRLNYGTWAEDVKVLLMDKNAWRIVNGSETRPADTEVVKLKDFQLRSDRAYSTIYLSIDREYRTLISGTEDPAKAWEKLSTHFRPDSRARTMGLLDEFFSCRINEGEPIGLYAARLLKLTTQLKEAEKTLEEWLKSFQKIRYLPPEYNSIVQTIYRWKDEEFTFDAVVKELLAEESRLKQAQGDQDLVALQTQDVPSANFNYKKSRFKKDNYKPKAIKCFKCGKRGHKAAECRSKIQSKELNKINYKNSSESNFIIEASLNEENSSNSWIIDTAASAHFCGNRDLFQTFKPLKDTNMHVAIQGCFMSN